MKPLAKPGLSAASLFASLFLFCATQVHAQVAFTRIARSDQPGFTQFAYAPSINASGTVAFSGIEADGNQGLFTGSGGALTNIVDSRDGVYTPARS